MVREASLVLRLTLIISPRPWGTWIGGRHFGPTVRGSFFPANEKLRADSGPIDPSRVQGAFPRSYVDRVHFTTRRFGAWIAQYNTRNDGLGTSREQYRQRPIGPCAWRRLSPTRSRIAKACAPNCMAAHAASKIASSWRLAVRGGNIIRSRQKITKNMTLYGLGSKHSTLRLIRLTRVSMPRLRQIRAEGARSSARSMRRRADDKRKAVRSEGSAAYL